ncbi:MAG: hypothetical protein B7Z60_04135 [Ferrovum sp. 37-45-19]|nr:MAG: hypothetical protein B7Z65_05365 [Ferrovum sp. 21-44-67]OYV94625.1 MAG: hypothetical protein B7Z60_04135 [Ferrovum sp. 37-45-19]OZB34548.1 MAG: hypothetical protein B7X47_00665 [Ferrovum sp. 34-44-207]HQU06388.1 hypothetical protein [Ferrovaceae bacterium]
MSTLALGGSLGVDFGGKYKGPLKPQPFKERVSHIEKKKSLVKFGDFMGNKSITLLKNSIFSFLLENNIIYIY